MMAKKFSACGGQLIEIGSLPHQPQDGFPFPKRKFGHKNPVERSFQHNWFSKWSWLHYNAKNDSAFCFVCTKAMKEKKIRSINVDSTYISSGFTNWKDATSNFKKHEVTESHRAAVEAIIVLPATTRNVGELLSEKHMKEKAINRSIFLKILSNIRFLCRQGLPLHGHGDESDGNFMQTLKFQSEVDPSISLWIKKKSDKYTSPQIQNEIIKIMGLTVLREVVSSIQAACFYTIMSDEATDCSNKEQVVIVLRWVDENLAVHEDFIGLYTVDSIESKMLLSIIEDTLMRLNLSTRKIRGQCYDGASNMSGIRSGLAKLIRDKEPKAVYTHCYGHSLSLASMDAIKGSSIMKRALDCTQEIIKLIKFSPRRDSLFQKIKSELAPESPGIRVLCPTRWTVRGDALASIISNYSVLQQLWEEARAATKDTEIIGRLIGVTAIMEKFDFLFGCLLGELVLQHTDNLSKTLQNQSLSAAEGQQSANLTVKTLQSIRTDQMFDLFWEKATMSADKLSLDPPSLPRKRRCPSRFETGLAEPEYHDSPKSLFKASYFEALDFVTTSIKERFNQPGYEIYINLQELLTKAAKGESYSEEYEFVIKFYEGDFHPSRLKIQLELLHTHFSSRPGSLILKDVIGFLTDLSTAHKELFSEVIIIAHLILVMPATNASSERSFSCLRRVKTYLRNSMNQDRLNHVMLLHVHKDNTDRLNLQKIGNDFVANNEHRLQVFGKF